MRIGIIGAGVIGKYIADKVISDPTLDISFIYDEKEIPRNLTKYEIRRFEDFDKTETDIVVEAAGHEAVKEYAVKVLEKTNLLVMSVGALADAELEEKIKIASRRNGTKFYVAPGAIIGIDGITTVQDNLENVELVTTKNPKSLGRDDTTKTIVFEGTAREACPKFPRNVNVAATLALNGIGFDRTKVKIISDPEAKSNTHEITATGAFGKFTIKVEAAPSSNLRTSGLATTSAFETIKKIQRGLSIY